MNTGTSFSSRLTLTALLLTLFGTALGQQPSQTTAHSSAEDARIARLVGLARVWGAVKYFHPFLAYREIDWDKALVDTIPKVSASRTSHEYQAVLNRMLGALGDKGTVAEIDTETKSAPLSHTSAAAKEPVLTENGVLVVDAIRIAEAGAQNLAAFRDSLARISDAIPTARGVIIDGRAAVQPDEFTAYYFALSLRRILSQLFDGDVTLGSTRYRMHNGYATQTGSGASFYYSAFVNVAPETIGGRNKMKTPPMVFIVNEDTPTATSLLSGLQSANRAYVIQDGEQAPGTTSGAFTLELPDHVKVRIRTYESINPDGSIGFQADAVVPKGAGEDEVIRQAMEAVQPNSTRKSQPGHTVSYRPQVSEKDKPYAEMEYPATEHRLLALFRFWNVINYFFPYKDLIGYSWESVLPRYIPKFEADKDAADYQLTVREMVAEMHDSHARVQNAIASMEWLGMFLPPVIVRYVENQAVITRVWDDKLPVKIGDVILTVDGEPVEKRVAFLSRFIAASTPQALMKDVYSSLLFGQKDRVAKLRVRGGKGEVREVEIARSMSIADPRSFTAMERTTPVVQVLPSGCGYVDLARLQRGEVDKMFETIKNTPGVVFDMRGYPNGTAWAIAPRLTEKNRPVAALFSRRLLEAPSLSDSDLSESASYTFAQRLPERKGDVYKGKVVMLINEDAISQAEHTCMFFEAATDVTFIGTPTTGANGDVTFMVLPGNLIVSFTGHNVRHADGRQLQRVGIQPTIRVAPTIRGIIAGRDEVLEAAVKYLRENGKK